MSVVNIISNKRNGKEYNYKLLLILNENNILFKYIK